MRHIPLEVRLFSRTVCDVATHCWLWTGPPNASGYGVLEIMRGKRGVSKGVHRIAYELFVGPIPDGAHLHHTCKTRHCCNPAHLQPLAPAAHARLKHMTHCPQGHPYEGNLVPNQMKRYGRRTCIICQRAAIRAWGVRNKARVAAKVRERRLAKRLAAAKG